VLEDDDFIEMNSMGSEKSSVGVTESEPEEDVSESPMCLTAPKLRLKPIESNEKQSSEEKHHEDEDEDEDDNDDSDSDDSVQQFVEFTNFPVQVTLLERAEGTLEELVDNEDDSNTHMAETKTLRWSAWLFQIIAGLTCAQHMFGFVHNDLHTNNIMWSGTGITYLYYKLVKGNTVSYMKVPTFGRILKIIDFGRATYHLPDPCGFIISDAFFPGNDASTQYNCEPFYNPNEGKRVEPNTSFDLGRLAVSLLESLYPERPKQRVPISIMSREGSKLYMETVSPVYNLIWEWLQDDDGKNILRTPEGMERYPDFELYRVLASRVHKAVPKKQIEKELFGVFKCDKKDIDESESVYTLHL
jgi:hypothetical protein